MSRVFTSYREELTMSLNEPTPGFLLDVAAKRERRAALLRRQAQDALAQAAEHERHAAQLREQAQAMTA